MRPQVASVHTPFQFTDAQRLSARPGQTIREIADAQAFHLPFIALLNGKAALRAAWDHVLETTDTLLFVTLPAGGGTKDVFRFVLQIAITVSATALLGPGGLGLTGFALSAGVLATTVAGSFLINALLPPTAASLGGFSSGPEASPTYSLTAQGNQARLGGQIPNLFGRHLLVPDFAAPPYTEFVGNDLYLYELFSLGLTRLDVELIRIAKTDAWTKAAGLTASFSDIEFEIVPPGGEVTLFPPNVVTSVEVSGQTLEGPSDGGDWLGPFVAVPVGATANFLAVDAVWPGGAGHINDDGSLGEIVTTLSVEARKIDDAGAPLGAFFVLVQESFTFATRTAQRVSRRVPVAPGRYEMRMKRVNDESTDTRDFSEVHWDAARAYLVGDNSFAVGTLAMRARATNQLSSQASRQISVVATSMLPVWTGVDWSAPVATRDIFPIVADILRNTDYGAGRPDNRIDIEKLASLHQTWLTRGDTFDGVFDRTQSIWDVLTDVLTVGRARPIEMGDTVTFVRDEKQTVPKLLLTPREIVNEGFRVDYDLFNPATPDDVLVEFVDERTWDVGATVRATLPGSASSTPARKAVKGIVDRTRAWKFGMYWAAQFKYRREYPSTQVEFDGRILKSMDLVALSHPLCDYGRPADVVDYDAATRTLKLSQRAQLSPTETNFMRLRQRDGAPWGPVIVTEGASDWHVAMDAADLAAVTAAQGDPALFIVTPDSAALLVDDMEPTVAVIGHGASFERDTKLIGARYDGGGKMTLALVTDDDRVYTADEGAPPAEAAASALPKVPEGPVLGQIDVVIRGTRFAPELGASVRPAPGAVSYIWQRSYDHVTWTLLQDGGATTWEGAVEATTVWLRVTAVGAHRGTPVEWFGDLTATQAPPAAVIATLRQVFFTAAAIDVVYPAEDGVDGIIAKVGTAIGFDPELAGTVVYDGSAISQIAVDITAAPTVYVRVAAFNRFGKLGLNWSAPLAVTALKVGETDLAPAVANAFGNAAVLDQAPVWRLDANGDIAGFGLIQDGVLNPIIAALLVDVLQVRLPGGGSAPLLTVDAQGVFLNDLFAKSITADTLNAVWSDLVDVRAGRIRGPLASGDKFDINPTLQYWKMTS